MHGAQRLMVGFYVLALSYLNHNYPIKNQCCPHIETSQLICTANQLTSFYIRGRLAFNGLNKNKEVIK